MKKFLLLIIIILAAGFLYFKKHNVSAPAPSLNNNLSTTEKDPSNGTFSIDDEKFTLSNGKAESENGTVELLEEKAAGDINKDGKDDNVLLLAQSGGGSGVFIYIAAYISGPVSYKGTNAIFIGDRISPESVAVSNGVITLKYLDREPDESFASEPTVPKTLQFVLQGGILEEK